MRLILVRHAKSSWDDPRLHDHDRPLSKRGRNASSAVGAWLAKRGYVPQVVLSSTSERTRETWARMAKSLPKPAEIRFLHALYHCSPKEISAQLKLANVAQVLVLGHNPGIATFAQTILEQQPRNSDFYRFPTASTLVCDLPAAAGPDIEFGTGKLVDFITPHDI